VGVESAFITVPGHIFVAVSLAMTPEQSKKAFSYVEDLIFHENQTWIPVEVTQTRGGFLKAWQAGARQWREASARDLARFYPTHEAWRIYEPVGLPGAVEHLQLPELERVATLYLQELAAFAAKEVYSRVAQIESEMAGKGETPVLLNQLGILYARYGIADRAEREFARAVALDAGYVPALVNLGNLRFKAQGAKAALTYYEKAYGLAPDNPTVLVSLAKAHYELENYGTVNETLSRLNQIRLDLARRFAYLEMRGPEAERAAAVGGAREELIWAE
jgi:tetratricopeptide (TPR) repeat protein